MIEACFRIRNSDLDYSPENVELTLERPLGSKICLTLKKNEVISTITLPSSSLTPVAVEETQCLIGLSPSWRMQSPTNTFLKNWIFTQKVWSLHWKEGGSPSTKLV